MINPWIGSLGLLLVVLLDGLMAAGRSALVNSRPGRLQAMQAAGVPGAARANRIASESTRFLLSLRFGRSLLRLVGIGLALALYGSLTGGFQSAYAVPGVLAAVLGIGAIMETLGFVAENVVLRDPEAWAARLATLVSIVVGAMAPFGTGLLRLAGSLSGAEDGPRYPMVTEEEIMTLVDAGEEGGSIEQDEKAMIYSILQLDNTLAREVMVPRIDLLAFEESTPLLEATDALLESGFSRAPVFRRSIDNVLGLVYVKDLLSSWRAGVQDQSVGDIMREAYFVPEAKKADDLLEEMQARRIHMAIVVDEYGGTAGVVTIEDIVEEIIGEIRDEYDFAEEMRFQSVGEGEYLFSGGIDLDDVNQIAGADLPKDTSETLGGFIYGQLGRVPSPGERLEAGGMELVVEAVVRRRIRRVRGRKLQQPHPGGAADFSPNARPGRSPGSSPPAGK